MKRLRILYAVSPIGLGHASRSLAIALELKKKGYEIEFLAGGNAVKFLRYHNFKTVDFHTGVPYFKVSDKGELKGVTSWMIRYIRFYKKMKEKARKLLKGMKNDVELVISDEDFAFATVAIESGINTVFVTDLIQTHFGRNFIAREIEKRTNKWFREFYKQCPLIIVPDEEGEAIGNMEFVGPIARRLTQDDSLTRKELGIEKDNVLITATSGGSPIGRFIFESVKSFLDNSDDDKFISIFVGESAKNYESKRVKSYNLYPKLQNIISASDIVVTTAGKSTIDECRIYGTRCIAIPIKGHFEQERNALKLGFKHEDIYNLDKLISYYLKKPKPKPINNNLEKAVNLIIKNI